METVEFLNLADVSVPQVKPQNILVEVRSLLNRRVVLALNDSWCSIGTVKIVLAIDLL